MFAREYFAINPALSQGKTLFVSLTRNSNILKESWQLIQQQRLGAINQRLIRRWMEIREHQVGPSNDPLRSHMHYVKNAFRPGAPRSNCV